MSVRRSHYCGSRGEAMQTAQLHSQAWTSGGQPAASVPAWYPLQTRYQCEKKVYAALCEQGLECFAPMRLESRRWSDRTKLIESPLFPGYLFVRMIPNPVSVTGVLRLRGMARFVTAGHELVVVSNTEIDKVRALARSDISYEAAPFPAAGERVRITGGCLEGVEGVVTGQGNRRDVVISIGGIQRSLKIALGNHQIERLD
jgi:transcriptional antiterminator NusG